VKNSFACHLLASQAEAGARRSVARTLHSFVRRIAELGPGVSLTIPIGTHFQFRCDGHEPLDAIGATMPPWPGESEAFFVDGAWQPTV
jgi:mannose-6-phosphate isomerase-like protein (cupin superfamily)